MTDRVNVVPFTGEAKGTRDYAGDMAEEIAMVIDKYRGKVPTVLAIGVLEVVKSAIVRDAYAEIPQ